MLIATTAVICGAETWKQIESFGKDKEYILELPNGISSDDTINRLLGVIDSCEINPFLS